MAMKRLTLLRHAESAYNSAKKAWQSSPEYQDFLSEYKKDWQSSRSKSLAIKVAQRFSQINTDHATELTEAGIEEARQCGSLLTQEIGTPDVVVISPYLRTRQTWQYLKDAWPHALDASEIIDERVREQEFGLRLLYGDWRALHVCHPEQRPLYALQGPYWYRHPQGENIPDVRERVRQWLMFAQQEYIHKNVLVITHHITILAFKAELENMSPEEYIELYRNNVPVHCGITQYQSEPDSANSKLRLEYFNKAII